MRFINELHEGDRISDVYLCKVKREGTAKSGKQFFTLVLADKTGTIDAKVWEPGNPGIREFAEKDFIDVVGKVGSYNGALQISVDGIRVADEGDYVLEDYIPCTSRNVEEMYTQLLDIIGTIKRPYYKELLEAFYVNNKSIPKLFRSHSAAKSMHHAFAGGLLEHTLAVTSICNFFCTFYPDTFNRDLLLSGALLHDIGKLMELSSFPENDYTDSGQLLGHITMGTMLIRDEIKKLTNEFPTKEANELLHLILSHHGALEYGSPKMPALIEAVALSFADNADAKIQGFKDILNANPDKDDWLGWQKMFEGNIRRTTN